MSRGAGLNESKYAGWMDKGEIRQNIVLENGNRDRAALRRLVQRNAFIGARYAQGGSEMKQGTMAQGPGWVRVGVQ